MPLKPGGGGLPQPYDPDNGQYTDKMKSDMLKNDSRSLFTLKYYGYTIVGEEPHFPTYGIHDDNYGKLFVETHKHYFNSPSIADSKTINYLLDEVKSGGKSKLLNLMGYWKINYTTLAHDILHNTNFETIKYNMRSEYCLKVKALTVIGGTWMTTIWKVDPKDYKLQFVTLIPRKDVYDKD